VAALQHGGRTVAAQRSGTPTPAVAVTDFQPRSSTGQPLDVSLIQLIARPQDYDGEYVRVFGFYRHEFEGTALYLHREDYEHALYKNGLWMTTFSQSPALSAHNMTYVLVEGRFNAKRRGHLSLWSGEISEITRTIPWPPKR